MKKFHLALILLIFSTGCATIVSKSSYPIYLNTQPVTTKVTIKDKNGFTVFQEYTPASVKLPASSSFFKKASYIATFEAEGYEPLYMEINGEIDKWYVWGNLLLLPPGWILGWLIIDPATGSMYKIPLKYVNELMEKIEK